VNRDLPSELLLGRTGDDEQQGPVDVPHGVNLRKLKRRQEMASFSHTGAAFGRRLLDGRSERSTTSMVFAAKRPVA
jgi:hypothetical protein